MAVLLLLSAIPEALFVVSASQRPRRFLDGYGGPPLSIGNTAVLSRSDNYIDADVHCDHGLSQVTCSTPPPRPARSMYALVVPTLGIVFTPDTLDNSQL